ncbi:hypothetical protein ASPACDRAFT_108730 [Aspergillus aculeatus ATCC 16872]|uniref:Uncharacterized protein n=1 Tax=Aspergillus aculeatus (strain ATCC 16872 / CBS 172.66 / WB 5094) TaxID=690307 RepID=A0A1L9X761_ASPA1|nr:uncharacterized protein ASPACDRAFT_108730 [Aspergillus aculeatus ATCC 16872]OJK04285.1 hypothetical protein ASPACDRAFT_108730 [Aspergillus aculeatus ATCC 16872]
MSLGYTTATPEMKASVAEMVDRMMKPKVKPDGLSFTMGWDVVASYSEKQINDLLQVRHRQSNTGMLQTLSFTYQEEDIQTEEYFDITYDLRFGPPLVQFDAHSLGQPMCTLEMEIVEGAQTVPTRKRNPVRPMPPGWKLRLHDIPLASVRGRISEEGAAVHSDIISSDRPVHFSMTEKETQHVVLGFQLANTSYKLTLVPPATGEPSPMMKALDLPRFEKYVNKYFQDDVHALSYSIASLNNVKRDDSPNLQPVKFQFATFKDHERGILSLFIQVKGGFATGRTQGLQSHWQNQWEDNGIQPIPKRFTASLLLSSNMLHRVLFQQAFKGQGWEATNMSPTNEAENRISATLKKPWTVPEQNYDYDRNSKFHVDGFTLELEKWPLTLTIRQDEPKGSPQVYAHWTIDQDVDWKAHTGIVPLGSGVIKAKFRLCDERDHNQPRRLDCKIRLDDESFGLDMQLNTKVFRMDQGKDHKSEIDFLTWERGMAGLWTQSPNVTLNSVGLGILRATNLLTPGGNSIDFNEEIGIKAPKDFLLVGDVLET